MNLKQLPLQRFGSLTNFIRVLVATAEKFGKDKCNLKASALTYWTLLSLVPILAVGFGISKGFGFDKHLEAEIRQDFVQHEVVIDKMIGFAHTLLDNTRGGLIAGIGVVTLLWTVMKVLGHIESSLNDIWRIDRSRTFARRVSDYLAALIICPLVFILSSSLNVFVTGQIEMVQDENVVFSTLGPVALAVMKWFSYFLSWLLFTLLYMFLPNAKMRLKTVLIAGVVAGTGYQLAQWSYLKFQVGVANFGAIYGSFAALPLFLVWVQISWLIVLGGAAFAFNLEHSDTFGIGEDGAKLSTRVRRLIALAITHKCVLRQQAGERAASIRTLAVELKLPVLVVKSIANQLVKARVLTLIPAELLEENCFHPRMDINTLTIERVVAELEKTGENAIELPRSDEITSLTKLLEDSKLSTRLVDI